MKKYIIASLICLSLGLGCAWAKKEVTPIKNPVTGEVTTPLSTQLTIASNDIKAVSGVIPGLGVMGGAIGGILSLIANGILAVATKNRGGALDVTIAGTEQARKDYKALLNGVADVVTAANPALGDQVKALVKKVVNEEEKIDPVVTNVTNLAKSMGVDGFLDGRVQSVTQGV